MLTLYKRGKVYWLRGSVAGRRIHKSCGTADRETADQIRTHTEAREWKGRLFGAESVLTFGSAAHLYITAGKSTRFLLPILELFRDTPVKEMKPGMIRQASVTLYPHAGPATRNRQVISPTQAVINHAAEAGLCQPIRVKRFKVQRAEKPPVSLQWVEAFALSAQPRVAALAWFMFLTGARISNAIKLGWADVDLSTGAAILRKPKGQDDVRVHLPPMLVAMLANLEGSKEPWQKVFGYKSRQSVMRAWTSAIERAGIARLTPHACRHGFATGLLREGIDPVTVAHLGHWKSPRHVYETYGHALKDRSLTERLLRREGK
jgi:integrase